MRDRVVFKQPQNMGQGIDDAKAGEVARLAERRLEMAGKSRMGTLSTIKTVGTGQTVL